MLNSMVKYVIGENEAGQRADRFLRKYFAGVPLSRIYRIIRKDLKVNGRRIREDQMLKEGDELTLYISPEQFQKDARQVRRKPPARRQFKVIYEDPQVLVVSKPRGLLVHGNAQEKSNTLQNQVCGYLQDRGEYDPAQERIFTPSPVNRLDRNTTGLVIFGKTAAATRALTSAIRSRDGVRKFYLAIARGQIREEMILTDRLRKDEEKNRVTVDEAEGKSSETHIRPLRAGDHHTLVEVELITGRTHQIRVHLAKAGHPLAGDPKYGKGEKISPNGSGQLLHAYRLVFGELGQPLEELSGKTLEARPPKVFDQAVRDLVGRDAEKNY